jgi:hypothetical protein
LVPSQGAAQLIRATVETSTKHAPFKLPAGPSV